MLSLTQCLIQHHQLHQDLQHMTCQQLKQEHHILELFLLYILLAQNLFNYVHLFIMKNFNRCDSHGHHGSKLANWRNTHTYVDRTHSLKVHTLYIDTVTTLTVWCEAPAQLLFFSACWVFLCFRNPPNSDMDHRIFIMRT